MAKGKGVVIIKARCLKCGYRWEPYTGCPKECPACKSRNWMKKKKAVA